MSQIKKAVLKVAQETPEFARLLKAELSKKAGGYTVPLKSGAKIGPRQIKAFVYKSNDYQRDWLDQMDWSKVEWEQPDKADMMTGFHGAHVLWRVFKQGEYGDRKSDHGYLWGYVFGGVTRERGGVVETASYLYLKI